MAQNGDDQSNRSLAFGIAIGIAIGAGIGVALGNVGIGVAIGLALGVALGSTNWFGSSGDADSGNGDTPDAGGGR